MGEEALPAMLLVTHFKMRAKYSQNRLSLFMERFGDWMGRILPHSRTKINSHSSLFPLSLRSLPRSICHFLARHNYGKVIIQSVDVQCGTKSRGCGKLANHRLWTLKLTILYRVIQSKCNNLPSKKHYTVRRTILNLSSQLYIPAGFYGLIN